MGSFGQQNRISELIKPQRRSEVMSQESYPPANHTAKIFHNRRHNRSDRCSENLATSWTSHADIVKRTIRALHQGQEQDTPSTRRVSESNLVPAARPDHTTSYILANAASFRRPPRSSARPPHPAPQRSLPRTGPSPNRSRYSRQYPPSAKALQQKPQRNLHAGRNFPQLVPLERHHSLRKQLTLSSVSGSAILLTARHPGNADRLGKNGVDQQPAMDKAGPIFG